MLIRALLIILQFVEVGLYYYHECFIPTIFRRPFAGHSVFGVRRQKFWQTLRHLQLWWYVDA